MAENPVIRRFASNVATPSAIDLQKQYEQPAYVGARPNQRFMTLDDVVQRTAAMLLTILAAGAVAWTLSGDSLQHVGPLLLVGLMGGVGLGLFMAFTGRANAPLAWPTRSARVAARCRQQGLRDPLARHRHPGDHRHGDGRDRHAVRLQDRRDPGDPAFTRIVIGATIGVFGLMVVNLVAYLFSDTGLGLRSGGPLAILFSLSAS